VLIIPQALYSSVYDLKYGYVTSLQLFNFILLTAIDIAYKSSIDGAFNQFGIMLAVITLLVNLILERYRCIGMADVVIISCVCLLIKDIHQFGIFCMVTGFSGCMLFLITNKKKIPFIPSICCGAIYIA